MLIRVNPADYDTMISNLEVLREESRLKDITIEPSESVSPGAVTLRPRRRKWMRESKSRSGNCEMQSPQHLIAKCKELCQGSRSDKGLRSCR